MELRNRSRTIFKKIKIISYSETIKASRKQKVTHANDMFAANNNELGSKNQLKNLKILETKSFKKAVLERIVFSAFFVRN